MSVLISISRAAVVIELTQLYLARAKNLHSESNETLEHWINEIYSADGGYQIVE